ncbi:MAG TPA: FGGY family carbohydrate kinase [Candidatus Limnocylindrales bacterium]|jgi:xylulokinase|nr:FGGY family carbohydrate kinase [Candidatus Limnocylindrales bacterium]
MISSRHGRGRTKGRWPIYVIGCDVGSQSLKGVLIDPDGVVRATAADAYPVTYPRDVWAEQDPRHWQDAAASVVARLKDATDLQDADIGAIGFASQVDGVVAVDGALTPLRPAILWMDRRASREADEVRATIDLEEVRAVTGLNLDAYHCAPKIAWIRRNEPEVAARATGYLLPGSFLVAWLSGERVVDHANASSTMLYDITTRDWSPRMLDAFDLAPEQLGRVEAATTPAGTLAKAPAERLGLTTDCTVVVGTGDEHGAALGAGAVRPGIVCDITGTAEPVGAAALEPVIDPSGLLETHGHADPRAWFIENPGFVSGGSVRWFIDLVGGDEARLNDEAATVPPGSAGLTFLPALAGSTTPRWDEHARGAFSGLALGHERAHLGRALLEGCTFGLRDLVGRLAELGLGGDADEIRVVGGGARSETWLQMKADATGRVVRVLAAAEATALGAAYLAGTAAGVFTDLDDAIARGTTLQPRAYEPDPTTRSAYDDAYSRYRALFEALAPLELGRGGGR